MPGQVGRPPKKAYSPPPKQKLETDSRSLCTVLNNLQAERGIEPYGAIYRCVCCGKFFVTQEPNFYKNYSPLYENNNGYGVICKSCVQVRFDEHFKETDGDWYKSMELVCHECDWPYDKDTFDSVLKANKVRRHLTDTYAQSLANAKYGIGLSYTATMLKNFAAEKDECCDECACSEPERVEEVPILMPVPETVEEIIDEETLARRETAAKFFGNRFSGEELDYLQEQYDEWVDNYDGKSKSQKELFKNLCLIQLKIYNGDATKDDIKSLQDLMDSGNLKPKQQVENTLADQNTFGTLIQKWENEKPVPEALPEWKDVDGIKKYVNTWFFGHLCKMFNFNNEYAQQYEDELEDYTVEPPRYTDEDLTSGFSSVMFKKSEDSEVS